MMKKGHKRKNWTERWFELHLDCMSYYVSEDLMEQKGCITLDRNCCVEVKAEHLLQELCYHLHTLIWKLISATPLCLTIQTFFPYNYEKKVIIAR